MLSAPPAPSCTPQAETDRLRDPLLSQQRARSAEDRVVFRCLTGQRFTDSDIESVKLPLLPLVPQGRHGTTSNTWLAMPLGDIESPVRKASRCVFIVCARVSPSRRRTSVAISCFEYIRLIAVVIIVIFVKFF